MKLQCIFILLLMGTIGYGQGMTLHAGGSTMKNGLLSMTPERTSHNGYLVGADGRLGDDDFYFLIGLQYHKLDFNPTEKFAFKPTDPSYNIIKGKGGFAFKVLRINKEIVSRLRVFGGIDYLLGSPVLDESHELTGTKFNEAVAGLGGGLEVDIYFLTLNVDYQKGFFKSLEQTENSSLDFLTFSLGINF